jgi:hypothetical protein
MNFAVHFSNIKGSFRIALHELSGMARRPRLAREEVRGARRIASFTKAEQHDGLPMRRQV